MTKYNKDIPAPARIDRTWDNGTESSCHLLVDEALGMLTYHADPYSSYQRGTNENRNVFCFNVCSTGSAVFFRSVG